MTEISTNGKHNNFTLRCKEKLARKPVVITIAQMRTTANYLRAHKDTLWRQYQDKRISVKNKEKLAAMIEELGKLCQFYEDQLLMAVRWEMGADTKLEAVNSVHER